MVISVERADTLLLLCSRSSPADTTRSLPAACTHVDRAVVHGRGVSQILCDEIGERRLHAGAAIGDNRLARRSAGAYELLLQLFRSSISGFASERINFFQ